MGSMAEMVKQTEGRRLALCSKSTSLRSLVRLVGWCGAAFWVREELRCVNANDSISIKKGRRFNKNSLATTTLSRVCSLGNGRFCAQQCSLTQRRH